MMFAARSFRCQPTSNGVCVVHSSDEESLRRDDLSNNGLRPKFAKCFIVRTLPTSDTRPPNCCTYDQLLTTHGVKIPVRYGYLGVTVRSTVLVVDDDSLVRQTLAALLTADGYRVLTAENVEMADAILRSTSPDVLLVDVRLGAFNGLQLIAMAEHPIPSIVMTGHDDITLKRTAAGFGAEYLVKPIPADVLFATVRRQLDMSRRPAVPEFRENVKS